MLFTLLFFVSYRQISSFFFFLTRLVQCCTSRVSSWRGSKLHFKEQESTKGAGKVGMGADKSKREKKENIRKK
jgi:hypothetical protein